MTCPRCGRPVATARPVCLYCGAPLPTAELPAAPPPSEPPPPVFTDGRSLLLLDLRGASASLVADALGLSPFDARQRVAGGGWHLHRTLPGDQADAEAARLERAGLVVRVVAGTEAARRARPLAVRGGGGEGSLTLHTDDGAVRVGPESLFLIVRGPIVREYQTSPEVKRVRTATLEGGHRIHLHRRDDPRPLEVDTLAFDFGDAVLPSLSSLITIQGWLEDAAPGTPVDDGFRRLTPALAPARVEAAGRLGAADALRAPRRGSPEDGPVVLDNVEQFRTYSAWRAAVEAARPS